MDDSIAIRRSEAPVGASDRLRLARAARAAMLGVPGVITTDAGPAGLPCSSVAVHVADIEPSGVR